MSGGTIVQTLASGKFLIGQGNNLAAAIALTGDAAISTDGVVSVSSDVIVDADVKTSAAIKVTKLGTGLLIPANCAGSLTGVVDSCVTDTAAIKVTKLGTGLLIPANSAASLTGIVNSCVASAAAIDVTKLGTGLTIPANSASSLTNLQASALEGNIAQARIATALAAPGAIGGSTPAAGAFTEVTSDGKYAAVGPDASMGMMLDTGGTVTNGQTVAFSAIFGTGTVRVFLTPCESTTTVPYPSSVTTTNFVVNGEVAKTLSWFAIGPRP
jgi:hypothetical protein